MQQEDDLRALESIVQFARGQGVFFLILHLYWFCYEWLSGSGLTWAFVDRLLLNIQRSTSLFSSPMVTKFCAFMFLAVGCYGTKSVCNGRVSRTGMVIAHALNIWPILNLDLDGHLIVQAKERGKKKTIERIHRIISELCVDPEDQTLYICHSDIAEEAEQFGEDIKKEFGFRDVFYTYIGTTIGSNCGPGLMAAFFVGKKRTN